MSKSKALLALLIVTGIQALASHSRSLESQTGQQVDVNIAIISLVIIGAALGLTAVGVTMRSMGSWVVKARESKTTNPWTAIDRGEDPTV